MEQARTLRTWIGALLAFFVVYMLYGVAGVLLSRLSTSFGWDLITEQKAYRYAGIGIYCLVPLAKVMIGTGVRQSDNALSRWGGLLLMADGALSMVWQLLLLIGMLTSTALTPRPLLIAEMILCALFMCSALILIAKGYAHRKMFGWAIAATVFEAWFVIGFIYSALSNFSNQSMVYYSFFSVGVVVCEIAYFAQWMKHLKLSLDN